MKESNEIKRESEDVFRLRDLGDLLSDKESPVHSLGKGFVCDTETRGHKTPKGRSVHELVINASQGFIALWAADTTLRWRFNRKSLARFANPGAVKTVVRKLFAQAILEWGSAVPVKFKEDDDLWDFEIVMKSADDCAGGGCVLASAFFPDAGRHKLTLYPKLFAQSYKEQVDTMVHEIGHIFGLRHFFAQISERTIPSEIYGVHVEFSIMNYGVLSELTDNDRNDLRQLYRLAWAGTLTHINGTPIRFVKPYSSLAPGASGIFALAPTQTPVPESVNMAYLNGK